MTITASPQPPQAISVTTTTPAEAAELATHFAQIMQGLIEIVAEETKLVRAGRSREAALLERRKNELASLYLTDAARVKACRDHLRRYAPELLKELQQRHDMFRALLQINLTVLATAHAVAEGLVRGVSAELSRKAHPTTYTAQGRNAASPRAVPPMAVSRQL
jgi:hypothetical protein